MKQKPKENMLSISGWWKSTRKSLWKCVMKYEFWWLRKKYEFPNKILWSNHTKYLVFKKKQKTLPGEKYWWYIHLESMHFAQ